VIFLIVAAVNLVLGAIAGVVWRRKGGRYALGFLMAAIGGFVGLAFVLMTTPEE
jgi:hypothetical protein